MSCTNYTANAKAVIQFSVSNFPDDYCISTIKAFVDDLVDRLAGEIPANYTTFLISDTTPGPADRGSVWVSVNSSDCRPNGVKIYLNGSWVDVGARIFYGADNGAANAINLDSTTPTVNWQETGHLFVVKAAYTNTGASTINIKCNGTAVYATKTIKKLGAFALEGSEWIANSTLLLLWDGTYFQLLNPRPGLSQTGFNLSFDDDIDSDGVPDQWEVYVAPNRVYTGSGGADAETAPLGGAFTIDTSDYKHGSASVKFTCASGAGNGGGFIQTKDFMPCDSGVPLEVSWWCKTSSSTVSLKVEVLYYSAKNVSQYVSKETLWYNITSNPNGIWKQFGGISQAPSTGTFFKLRFFGGLTGNTAASATVRYDDVRVEPARFRNRAVFTSSSSWVCPANVYCARVKSVGPGGGGGGSDNTGSHYTGGGGGSGGTQIAYVPTSPGTQYVVSVGTKGSGGASGNNGTSGAANSYFRYTISAVNYDVTGNLGTYGQWGAGLGVGGIGGSASGPASPYPSGISITGSDGAAGGISFTAGGAGGSSSEGGGGGGGTTTSNPGAVGMLYGAGGGGAYQGVVAAGGNGTDGVVIVEW